MVSFENDQQQDLCSNLWFCFFLFQEPMVPKEQGQQAQLLVLGYEPVHGLPLMDRFGFLVVMDMTVQVLLVSVDCFFY
jgi:hypothetical protein